MIPAMKTAPRVQDGNSRPCSGSMLMPQRVRLHQRVHVLHGMVWHPMTSELLGAKPATPPAVHLALAKLSFLSKATDL